MERPGAKTTSLNIKELQSQVVQEDLRPGHKGDRCTLCLILCVLEAWEIVKAAP